MSATHPDALPESFVGDRPHDHGLMPLPQTGRAGFYAEVAARQKRHKIRSAGVDIAKTLGLAGSFLMIGWLVYNNGKLARQLAEQPVIYAAVRDDGEVMASSRWSEMPADKRGASLLTTLGEYVRWRECYSIGEFPRAWVLAQEVSDGRVGNEYRRAYDRRNPDSPQRIYGEKGIRVECDMTNAFPIGAARDTYEIHFERTEVDDRRRGPTVPYVATISFRTGIYPSDPRRGWLAKTFHNPAGVQVYSYPRPHPRPIPTREIPQ